MSALAEFMLRRGKRVGGCDVVRGEYVVKLEESGIKVTSFAEADLTGYEAVVYTDAIQENNRVLCEARRLQKALIPRGEFLAAAASSFEKVIAVSGCHGKTTCTAMLAHIFMCAQKPFACHIGGSDNSLTNFYMNGSEFFITEACEYRKNFLRLEPDLAVALNSAADHIECYGSAEELKKSYLKFVSKARHSVTLYGDLNCGGVTFGFDRRSDYSAREITFDGGKFSFVINKKDRKIGRVKLAVYGKHNVLNAAAAFAAADCFGLEQSKIIQGLENFTGVTRRFEYLGKYNGAECIADYAHHPDEIKATLKTARAVSDGKIFIIFQPHTYSRTKNLFSRFVAVLNPLKRLMIYKTFAAREYYDDGGSAYTLSLALKKSIYGGEPSDIINFLGKVGKGDTVLFLGAGDIYEIAKNIIRSQSFDCS